MSEKNTPSKGNDIQPSEELLDTNEYESHSTIVNFPKFVNNHGNDKNNDQINPLNMKDNINPFIDDSNNNNNNYNDSNSSKLSSTNNTNMGINHPQESNHIDFNSCTSNSNSNIANNNAIFGNTNASVDRDHLDNSFHSLNQDQKQSTNRNDIRSLDSMHGSISSGECNNPQSNAFLSKEQSNTNTFSINGNEKQSSTMSQDISFTITENQTSITSKSQSTPFQANPFSLTNEQESPTVNSIKATPFSPSSYTDGGNVFQEDLKNSTKSIDNNEDLLVFDDEDLDEYIDSSSFQSGEIGNISENAVNSEDSVNNVNNIQVPIEDFLYDQSTSPNSKFNPVSDDMFEVVSIGLTTNTYDTWSQHGDGDSTFSFEDFAPIKSSLFPSIHNNIIFEHIVSCHEEFRKRPFSDSIIYSFKYLKSTSFLNRFDIKKPIQENQTLNGKLCPPDLELEDQYKREMRGIIYSLSSKRIISRPFHKFFAINQCQEASESNVQKKINSGHRYWLLEKLDGYMITCFLWNGELRFRTKTAVTNTVSRDVESFLYSGLIKVESSQEGSVASPSSEASVEWVTPTKRTNFASQQTGTSVQQNKTGKHFPVQDLRYYSGSRKNYLEFCWAWIQNDYSPIFEYISKNHEVIVKYNEEMLTLLALRNNTNGDYISYDVLVEEAKKYDIPVVSQCDEEFDNISTIVAKTRMKRGIEGYVLRFDDGDMYKIKSLWYTNAQKTMRLLKWSSKPESYTWKLALDLKIDDEISIQENNEERSRLINFNDELLDSIAAASRKLLNIIDTAKKFASSREEFVEYVNENFCDENPHFLQCVYSMYSPVLNKEKDPTTVIFKHLKALVSDPDACRSLLGSEVRYDPKEQKSEQQGNVKLRQILSNAYNITNIQDEPVDWENITATLSQIKSLDDITDGDYLEEALTTLSRVGWSFNNNQFSLIPSKIEFLTALQKYANYDSISRNNSIEQSIIDTENPQNSIVSSHSSNNTLESLLIPEEQIDDIIPTSPSYSDNRSNENTSLPSSPAQTQTIHQYEKAPSLEEFISDINESSFPNEEVRHEIGSEIYETDTLPVLESNNNDNVNPPAQEEAENNGEIEEESIQAKDVQEYELDDKFDNSSDGVTYGDQREGIRQVNQYILGEKLGSGVYGKVVEAIDSKSLRRVAIKIMKWARLRRIKGAESRLKNEILINQKLKHPNVIEFYEMIHDEKKGKIYLVMEFAGAGSLSQVIDSHPNQKLPLPDIHHFFRQLIKGVEYIHSQGVVHLDIKPDNLMISPDRALKISDFGVSHQFKLFEGDRCENFYGTPTFASPQIANGESYSGEKADIWACGVTLYYLITGKYPFEGESLFQLYENIIKGEYEMPDNIPDDLKDLIQKLLDPDEERRPIASEVKKHPWFHGNDREGMNNREPLVDRWRSFSLSQAISKALHNSNIYHMSFKADGTQPNMSDIEREKCVIL